MARSCSTLFAAPFALAGLLVLGLGVHRAMAGAWHDAGVAALVGVVFTGVGVGLVVSTFIAGRKEEARERRRREHPDRPWLWRPDWAAGSIDSADRKTMRVATLFAAFWNLISIPMLVALLPKVLDADPPKAALVLLFPAVGVALLVWAARTIIRYRKYGLSRLEMDPVPAVIGHGFRGVVHARFPGVPPSSVRVALTCLKRVVDEGRNRSVQERILWQDERTVAPARARDRTGGATIPVALRIPDDPPPTDPDPSDDRILWRLQVDADVPGVDYAAIFEVPVFGEGTDTAGAIQALDESPPPVEEPFQPPPDSKIRVRQTRRGTEIFLPPARNPGAALGLTGFTALWTGAVVLIHELSVPVFFVAAFGVMDVLLVIGTLNLWFGTCRLQADRHELRITGGLLGLGRTRTLSVDEIADLQVKVGMQAGKTPYYDLRVIPADGGRDLRAATGFRDRRMAEWVADRIAEAMGAATTGS